jgi:hypothetical protein
MGRIALAPIVYYLSLGNYSHRIVEMAAATLLPIVPILLLPFILVCFVAVFPLWLLSLGVLGLLLVLLRGLGKLGQLAGTDALSTAAEGVHKAFRWVLTFGGLARPANESERTT